MENHEFLFDILIILLTSKLFAALARKFDLPGVVGLIVAGVVIGPGVLSIVSGWSSIDSVAQVGVILLMFSAGIEADFSKLRKTWAVSLFIASAGIIFTILCVAYVSMWFGISPIKSVFFAVALCATSTSVIAQTLHDMGKLDSNSGNAIVGAAVFDDIIGVIVLSLISNFSGGEISYSNIFSTIAKIVAFIAIASLLCYSVYRILNKFSRKSTGSQSIAASALLFAFFMAWVAGKFGMADVIGAYFAGLAFCQFADCHVVEEKVEFLSNLFFTPMFFISIGLQANFGSMTMGTVLFCLTMIVVGVLSKMVFCAVAARMCRYSTLDSVRIGIGMVARGEVTFIVANKGILLGLMDKELLSPLIVFVVVTTILSPVMLKYAFSGNSRPSQKLPSNVSPGRTATHA